MRGRCVREEEEEEEDCTERKSLLALVLPSSLCASCSSLLFQSRACMAPTEIPQKVMEMLPCFNNLPCVKIIICLKFLTPEPVNIVKVE